MPNETEYFGINWREEINRMYYENTSNWQVRTRMVDRNDAVVTTDPAGSIAIRALRPMYLNGVRMNAGDYQIVLDPHGNPSNRPRTGLLQGRVLSWM